MADYFTLQDKEALMQAKQFSELYFVAQGILERMLKPIGQVCGPISTGGTGSPERNLKRLAETINSLTAKGLIIFNQMPFQDPMARILLSYKEDGPMRLLEEFYLPVFKSGSVSILYFLSDWQTLRGASWEHAQALRLGINIIYLSE